MRWLFMVVFFWALPLSAGQLRLECPETIGLGLPFLVRVESPAPLNRIRVEWGGKTLDFPVPDREAQFLLGTDVLKSKPGTEMLRVTKMGSNPLVVEAPILVEKRVFPEQRLQVAEKMVSPSTAMQERIAQEQARTRQILGHVSAVNHLVLPLVRPVPGEVSSAYGLTRYFNDQPRNPHRGLDLRAAQGDPVQAAAPGQVVLAEEQYYGGRSVFIDHGLGVHSAYLHLHEILVGEGEIVEAGQVIGRVGMTGPHLHFGLSILDLSVDPSPLFFQSGKRTVGN